jgi:hypothetical protein
VGIRQDDGERKLRVVLRYLRRFAVIRAHSWFGSMPSDLSDKAKLLAFIGVHLRTEFLLVLQTAINQSYSLNN